MANRKFVVNKSRYVFSLPTDLNDMRKDYPSFIIYSSKLEDIFNFRTDPRLVKWVEEAMRISRLKYSPLVIAEFPSNYTDIRLEHDYGYERLYVVSNGKLLTF